MWERGEAGGRWRGAGEKGGAGLAGWKRGSETASDPQPSPMRLCGLQAEGHHLSAETEVLSAKQLNPGSVSRQRPF